MCPELLGLRHFLRVWKAVVRQQCTWQPSLTPWLRISLSLFWGVSAKFQLYSSPGVSVLTLPKNLLSSGATLPLNGKDEQSGTCPVIVVNASRCIPGMREIVFEFLSWNHHMRTWLVNLQLLAVYWLPKQSLCLFFNSWAYLTSWQSFQVSISQSWSHLPAVHSSGCLLEEGAVCSSGAGSVTLLPARAHSLLSLTTGQRGAAVVWLRSGSIVQLDTGLCVCTDRMRGRTLLRVQCRTFSPFPLVFTISLPRSCGLPYLVQSWSVGEWQCCFILWMGTIWGWILFLLLPLKKLQLETSQPQSESVTISVLRNFGVKEMAVFQLALVYANYANIYAL